MLLPVTKLMRSRFILAPSLLLIVLSTITPSYAQENRATIVGTIADAAGAALPNATVSATNIETNIMTATTSNAAGLYTLPFLPIGKYRVAISARGLKSIVREGIELRVGGRVQLDFKMEVGQVSETITVTGQAPVLETATASRGQVIDEEKVRDLPSLGRNPFLLATLASGVQYRPSNGSASFRPFDNGPMEQIAIAGGRERTNELMIDGAPNTATEGGAVGMLAFVPSPDAVQEFRVQSNNYDAQFGRTGGGTINVSLKSGTNQLHGSLYHYFRNNILNANTFQNNAAGRERVDDRWNQPGLVFDGPVWIPKVYNGRDKTFFMFSWEKIISSIPDPHFRTVPTLEQRNGDFRNTLNADGQPINIYDPLSTRPDPTRPGEYIRDPISCEGVANVICPDQINPVARKIMEYIPLPNQPGNVQGINNFFTSPNPRRDVYDQFAVRIDHNLSAAHKLSGRFLHNHRDEERSYAGYRREASPYYEHFRTNKGGGMDLTSTLSPALVSNFKINFIRHEFGITQYGDNFDIRQLGFPDALASQLARQVFPAINISDYSGFGGQGLGVNGNIFTASDVSTFSETLNKTTGSHSLKFGGDLRVMRDNYIIPTSSFGNLSFDKGFTQADPRRGDAASGNAFASFLLGYPAGGSVPINATYNYQHLYYSAFFQDDWRVNRKLTLNLGLRWDYESPITERYNQLFAGFDKDVANPFQAPGMSLRGGILFVDEENRMPHNRDLNNFGPRIGVAYQIDEKTVFRGGYGLSYLPTFDRGTSESFSTITGLIAAVEIGIPANSLSNPYPGGILRPTGSSRGLETLIGQGFTFSNRDVAIAHVHQFSAGLQRELPWGMVLDLSYIGSRSRALSIGRAINEPSATEITRGAVYLEERLPNPFAGLVPGTGLNETLVSRYQLLRPYSQYGGITEGSLPLGRSWYNSMQVRVEKRLSNGLHFLASYTFSKNMEATGWLNAQDPIEQMASVITEDDAPHRFLFSTGYDLPFFKNSNKWLRNIAGGWKVNGIATLQSGLPYGVPGGVDIIGDVNLPEGRQTRDRWINTCTLRIDGTRQNCREGEQPAYQIQQPYTFRKHSSRFPELRTIRPLLLDLSLFKTFRIKERLAMQLRAEAFNFTNTPWFGGPNLGVNSPAFGVVTGSQVNDQRNVQLAVKFIF
jgi:hypothetical protein